MKLVIISGRSGSGKSTALNLLEDEGYYCIDNLPVALIAHTAEHLQASDSREHNKVAICIDARNANQDMSPLVELHQSQPSGLDITILFLNAIPDRLLKRFSETRRRHPLSDSSTGLQKAIANERTLLEPIADIADLTIDTSAMTLHDLRSMIKARLVKEDAEGISILFESFGFKQGIPVDADIVYDIRILPNPHWDPALRMLTGQDKDVIEFLEWQPDVQDMFQDISDYLKKWLPHFEENNRSYLTVAIGCTGGQHRSVYMAEKLNECFKPLYANTMVHHRELSRKNQPL